MIDRLTQMLKTTIPYLLSNEERWDSLIVNRRKPSTYRVYTYLENGDRVCLHKFDPCHMHEAFIHPHPWAGAFMLLQGSYRMKIGTAPNREDDPTIWEELILTPGAIYQITNPLTFHNVVPLDTCYTIMLNGKPFPDEIAHKRTVTTRGKDLDKMPPEELKQHLAHFRGLLECLR
jgi:hypothetical protein